MACKGCSYFLVMFVIREHGMYADVCHKKNSENTSSNISTNTENTAI